MYVDTNSTTAKLLLGIDTTIDFKDIMQEFCSHILIKPQMTISTLGKIIVH